MTKKFLSILALAVLGLGMNAYAAENGDIYEVAACTETGGDVDKYPDNYANNPLWARTSDECLTAGQTAYFRLRLIAPETASVNDHYWGLVHLGSSTEALDWALFPPQICIFVSGVQRWATLVDVNESENFNYKFTDCIFKYTTKSGDFALPIVLGAYSGSTIVPALDPSVNAPQYAIDLRGKWQFTYTKQTAEIVNPNWWIYSNSGIVPVTRVLDTSLVNAGYNVQTVDFSSTWETNNLVWRSVHQGTSITVGGLTPQLVRKSSADEAVSLYVWSTNEDAVVVSGPNVEEVECDPNRPGVKFHVAKVTIGASTAGNATGDFKITGVNKTAGNGWSGIVLSPYQKFNERNTVGDLYDDYMVVPVRCVEELPPSVIVELDRDVAYATSDYKNYAAVVNIKLSQPVSETFKVKLNMKLSETPTVAMSEEEWGKYVRFSTADEVSALPSPTEASTTVELGGSVESATLYLFALRGDEHVGGSVNEMVFEPVAVGSVPAEIETFTEGAMQIVAQNPEIVVPVEAQEVSATQFEETQVPIQVADTYADMASDEGYEIYVKYHPSDTEHASGVPTGFKKLDGKYKPGNGNWLERIDDDSRNPPIFTWDTVGEYETKIYIVAPVSGNQSCGTTAEYRTVNAIVTPTKSVTVTTSAGDTMVEADEGDQLQLKVELSEATKVDLYAFLKIVSEDVSPQQFSAATPYVIGMTNSAGKCKGVKIGRGNTSVNLAKLKLLDGYGPATGEYLNTDFEVVLATVEDYNTATSSVPSKIVKGYESSSFSVTVNNVEPTIKRIELNSIAAEYDGYEYSVKLPKSQEQELQAFVNDPSTYDLNNGFECRWQIAVATERNGTYTVKDTLTQTGNPNTVKTKYSFPYTGWNRIVLQVKDKDMDDWKESTYTVYVQVLSNPGITVEPSAENILETSLKGSFIKVGLNYYDASIPLYVKLTVKPVQDKGSLAKNGELLLDSTLKTPPAGYESHAADNVYFLTFTSEVSQDVAIESMDGTDVSDLNGFYIQAEVINLEVNPKTATPWCDYYTANLNTKMYIQNVAPNGGDDSITFSPDSNPTSRWVVAGGSATQHPLTWRVRSDVARDLEAKISVTIIGGGGLTTNVTEATSGTFIPDFGSSQGDQEVTITVTDKDGGTLSRTWYFTITASKFLTTVASGPSGGNASIELSQKYTAAAGIGEGHVYAGGVASFDSASDFRLIWNCSSAASVPVYGWGYKVANPVDDGSLDSHDQPLNKQGGAKGATEDAYNYTESQTSAKYKTHDSFLYAWIMPSTTETTGNTGTTTETTYTQTISPERPLKGAQVGTVTLPTEMGENATTWPDTLVEAVFSIEYLVSDNMGDINQDRIPDLYFTKYSFTETSETQTPTGTSEEETTVDDLKSLADFNSDQDKDGNVVGDFLPASITARYMDLADAAANPIEFTAVLEVRGIDAHLNDAPAIAGVTGVKPTVRYTDPDTDETSTVSKLEYLAWVDYATAHGYDPADETKWSKWSPENPSDPTLTDTDGDGFTDGFEYYYWYRAHVGFMEGKNHVYLTGRKFNPAHPAEGDFISSAEIEAMMDPNVPASYEAKVQDSDNDGLPDIIEFYLGTDPFDFDTDRDGLPDGWEVMVAGTSPIKYATDDTVPDGLRNNDGDAMAFTTAAFEAKGYVPHQYNPLVPYSFAVYSESGDSDHMQWYVVTNPNLIQTEVVADSLDAVYTFEYLDTNSVTWIKAATTATIAKTENNVLAVMLDKDTTFKLNETDDDEPVTYRGAPVRIFPGTLLREVATETTACAEMKLSAGIEDYYCNAAWIYGNSAVAALDNASANGVADMTGFGQIAVGRAKKVPEGAVVVEAPSEKRSVAYLHYLVYQEFGFDPRTAWNPNTPLNARWGSKESDGTARDGAYSSSYGYAGVASRTRAFTAYDEFLTLSFLWNNGVLKSSDVTATTTYPWSAIFAKYTTNPRGPGETATAGVESADDEGTTTDDTAITSIESSDNGADTDEDGVPDGWELYVMSGPKVTKVVGLMAFNVYNYVGPNEMGPWEPQSAYLSTTDNDSDSLTELSEFSGTDTTIYYTNYTATVCAAPGGNEKWLNKFFPTDPWDSDTDDDGLTDKNEITSVAAMVNSAIAYSFSAGNFIYGTPVDNGATCIPGGGLNPCSVDTDLDGLPDKWEAQYAGTFDDTNGIQDKHHGIVNGMDGTVKDAYTIPWNMLVTSVLINGETNSDQVNRDYDRDGLENWQEYLTGTMRCWRYDDPISRWDSTPKEAYFTWDATTASWSFDIEKAVAFAKVKLGDDTVDAGRFWYETLVNTSGELYNPYLVMDQSPVGSQYFTRVKNGFDPAFTDIGTYYFFYDGVDHALSADAANAWFMKFYESGLVTNGSLTSPSCYMGTSPVEADSDHDGMDDYYELFHGMNPLLGAAGVRNANNQPCDLVYHAWLYGMDSDSGAEYESPVKAWRKDQTESLDKVNIWTMSGSPLRAKADARSTNTGMDFTVYPWLNGLMTADPDGDDIRNEEEAIQTRDEKIYANHTDPTPLWMTDSSYSNSLVRMFFRMPARFSNVLLGEPTFTHEGATYNFCDYGGYCLVTTADGDVPAFGIYNPDKKWSVSAQNHFNWMFSFEENEGYDTDHDGVNDNSELSGKINDETKPQDADSPTRRQAMYFPGDKSALQTLPRCIEQYPLGGTKYETEDTFRHYTVECWAYPESKNDSVVIERAIWSQEASAADEEFIRKNFQIAIKDGVWFTKYDTTGTKSGSEVFVDSAVEVELNRWVHLAATYDGEALHFYINGSSVGTKLNGASSELWPENGRNAIAFKHAAGQENEYDDLSFDKEYNYAAIIVGASLKTYADFTGPVDTKLVGKALDLSQAMGWDYYTGYFKGYVDEVRIWDGARTQSEIAGAMKERFTSSNVKSNRNSFYDQWLAYGYSRYSDAASAIRVIPELRYLFSFDSVFAADNVEQLAQAPVGFLDSDAGRWSRPDDWVCLWWKRILDAYGSRYADSRWVEWIPNTVTHATRFDGTTGDSNYWSKDYMGSWVGNYLFVQDAEPFSRWTQMTRNFATADNTYRSTSTRHQRVFNDQTYSLNYGASGLAAMFNFTGRNLSQFGDDLLPLGGAFVRYCDNTVGMWDEQGASTNWEITGYDSDSDGLPDWWETYADGEYRIAGEPLTPINPSTYLLYNGIKMTAREAYLRDLARGYYANGDGELVNDTTKYRQQYDLNSNGLPDWWENLYGISGASALDDSDNDGLSNYVEYLLSEVFRFEGIAFSPTNPYSVDRYTPDYFFKIGQLYAGEVFTDHDLMEDSWEDAYADTYSSRLVYDAFANRELDGWCNRSKIRYSKLVMPIKADRQSHVSAADGKVADYPVPTIGLTLNYNGNRQTDVENASVVVKFYTGDLETDPDAQYSVTSSEDATSNTLYRVIGAWSSRHAIGTLTPGNIDSTSIELQVCDDPTTVIYTWKLYYVNVSDNSGLYVREYGSELNRGTKEEYEAAVRKYGLYSESSYQSSSSASSTNYTRTATFGVELLSSKVSYETLLGMSIRTDPQTDDAVLSFNDGTEVGTVNLSTGDFDLNLGAFAGRYAQNTTNHIDVSSLEDKTYRIAYVANPSSGLPRKLYLGEATTGHVKEGKNTIIAFADINGSGDWDANEPYGMLRNVDISWRGTSATIELTDISPITPRIDLVADDSDRGMTRSAYYEYLKVHGVNATRITTTSALQLIDANPIASAKFDSGVQNQRLRVVRWLVDGITTCKLQVPQRVVLDKLINPSVRPVLSEADLLTNGVFDLDWQYFNSEVVNDTAVKNNALDVSTISYLVVVGDGNCEWPYNNSSNVTVNAMTTLITRKFGKTRVKPTPVAAGEVSGVLRSASPTFRWRMDCPDEEGYPAFRLQVYRSDTGTTVYDSGMQHAPARNANGEYVFAAPLYVGDKTLKGEIFENNANYKWKVSMYNSKFNTDDFVDSAEAFRMSVQTNGWSSGKVPVAVRYFGPKESYNGKVIRVRAYTSPDFSGNPVAAGFVAAPDDATTGVCVTNREIKANCELIGLPQGTYYLQAFIDSNTNGVCDAFETMGYLCQRDGTSADCFSPVAIKIADIVGDGDICEIFMEDADTDNDQLPDAWEYVKYGNLTTKGVEELQLSAAGEVSLNTNLTDSLLLELKDGAQDAKGGLAAYTLTTLSNAGTMALALNCDTSNYASYSDAISASISSELKEDGVTIGSLAFDDDGNVVIAVEAETEPANNTSPLATTVTTKTLTVKCDVYWKASLTDVNWTKVGETQTITVGESATTVKIDGITGTSGFFRVSLYK